MDSVTSGAPHPPIAADYWSSGSSPQRKRTEINDIPSPQRRSSNNDSIQGHPIWSYQQSLNNQFQRSSDSTVQDQLEMIADGNTFETRINERIEFADSYYEIVGKAQTIIDNASQAVAKPVTEPVINSAENRTSDLLSHLFDAETVNAIEANVKLPTLHLPKFHGSYAAWPTFSDAFKTSIHDNPRFRDGQKLSYLRSCLTGKAAEKIESLETTAANYSVAWDILERHYNNPTAIVNNRIKALFELPQCGRSNPNSLGDLIDEATKHYRALEAMNQPFLEAFPVYAITSKLDEQTKQRWKEHTQGKAFPSVNELLEFLQNRFRVLEDLQPDIQKKPQQPMHRTLAPQNSYNQRPTQHWFNQPKPTIAYPSKVTAVCHLCQGAHFTQYCSKLSDTDVNHRIEIVRKAGLCHNCLRSNHFTKDCHTSTCKKCRGKHHTILHIDTQNSNQAIQSPKTSLNSINIPSEVLLSTALIKIADNQGKYHTCRVLLDSGSQTHFITERLAAKLELPRNKVDTPVVGINQVVSTIKTSVNTIIQSRINAFSTRLNLLVVPQISGSIPTRSIRAEELQIPANVQLADPTFYKTAKIDGLIGAEIFYKLLAVGQFTLDNTAVTLQKTRLGWVVTGSLPNQNNTKNRICNLTLDAIHNQIVKFWEVEDGPQTPVLSREEKQCETHYQSNTTRDPQSGIYTVRLPFKENPTNLGESYHIALKRFHSLERSLDRNEQLKSEYTEFLREYIELGHMSVVDSPVREEGYYLPHHGVIKDNSVTTKLRVVFDASCKTSAAISLNKILMVGPTIQDDLFSLLVRFRSHIYVLTADITKMYRQIRVHSDDRNFQKILWRESTDQPIRTYRLNTVTYGTSCAPFLAIRTLHQLAADETLTYPIASRILRKDFYVDDLLTGAKTIEEAVTIREEITELCQKGGFKLRQWASNAPELLDIRQDKLEETHLKLDLENTVNALGIRWNAREDTISYAVKDFNNTKRITKRTILSQVAQLFDPLGLLAPIIIRAKMIMQELWASKLNWDESVSEELHTKWVNYCRDLTYIKTIKIARRVVISDYQSLQLHGFCDASEQAYGACIYMRSKTNNKVQVQLLCAKSRVAPLKTQTLPRLELCAAYLLSKLYKTIMNTILNSRPLTPLSSDPNDLSALTPAHFLIGDTLNSMPDYDISNVPSGRLSSWQHVQKMRHHFWQRWSKEYLHELTTRKKWHKHKPEKIEIGSIVTVQDDHLPAMQWTLARNPRDVQRRDDLAERGKEEKTEPGPARRSGAEQSGAELSEAEQGGKGKKAERLPPSGNFCLKLEFLCGSLGLGMQIGRRRRKPSKLHSSLGYGLDVVRLVLLELHKSKYNSLIDSKPKLLPCDPVPGNPKLGFKKTIGHSALGFCKHIYGYLKVMLQEILERKGTISGLKTATANYMGTILGQ
ncbi:uncharacterized protein LOC143355683 [Halictus rubicundus]|uniref:uncharacterized protein LOC143355683 n=1 Tax=Halictus rubicundus TaxID=77578 RepID=UPI00403583BB